METPQPMLVVGMRWYLEACMQQFNARHRMRGHFED
jgi:hypothetical protein